MKKKILCVSLSLVMILSIALLSSGCGSKQPSISVYNWGEYIDMDVLKQFEEETGIKVKYDTFGSNEEMYTKVKNGGGNYDILIPSDYMIERLIANDMLAELNYDNIPNAKYVMEKHLLLPQNQSAYIHLLNREFFCLPLYLQEFEDLPYPLF